MRNGLNIAAMSELVSEIKELPQEAQLYYSANSGSWSPTAKNITIGTLLSGTTRAARDFVVNFGELDNPLDDAPIAYEYALSSLGTCVLVTLVYGGSVKAITFEKVHADLKADFSQEDIVLNYDVNVSCDGSDEDIVFVADMVCKHSPNHRLFVESNTINVKLKTEDGDQTIRYSFDTDKKCIVSATSDDNIDIQPYIHPGKVKSTISWLHGTQYLASPSSTYNECHTDIAGFIIDQPKQFIGYDYGPNPQEILLASLLENIREYLFSCDSGIKVRSKLSGHIDLRGLTGVAPEIPPKLDELTIEMECMGATFEQIREYLDRSFSHSAIALMILKQNDILVTLKRDGKVIKESISSAKIG